MFKTSRKSALFLLFCIGFIFSFFSVAQAETDLKNIRLGAQKQDTVRLVLDLSDRPDYKVLLLKNPYRVVIDVQDTKAALDGTPLISAGELISGVRYGKIGTDSVRIVAETTKAAIVNKVFFLAPQGGFVWRLVIDIKSATESEFEKSRLENTSDDGKPATKKKNTDALPPAAQKLFEEKPYQQKPLIVLDAGHGGRDPGAISYSGYYEKFLTLRMVKELQATLLSTGKYRVRLTRSDDRELALGKRVKIARNAKADVFISIHADSAKNKDAKGLSVYSLSEKASDKEAAALAERENKADSLINVDFSDKTPEVANILIDLARRDTMNTSKVLAESIAKELGKNIRVLPNTHRSAGFAVLKSPDFPSVLVEIGYLSNPTEERLLRTPSYRKKLAVALSRAIDKFFHNKSIVEE